MTATAHALVGAAIASHVREPLLSGGLIVSSHFLLDAIPHWDFGTDWRKRTKAMTGFLAVADAVFGFIAAIVVFFGTLPFWTIITAVSLALLPDWVEAPWYIFYASREKKSPGNGASIPERITYAIYSFESFVHSRADLPLGGLTQVGTVLFFFLLLHG